VHKRPCFQFAAVEQKALFIDVTLLAGSETFSMATL